MTFLPPTTGDPRRMPPAQVTAQVATRPSWVAWVALGLSALSLVVATSIGILYAVDRLGLTSSSEEVFFDAGLPFWGVVDLSPSGGATDLALIDGLEDALIDGLDDGIPVEEVYCEPLPGPKKDTVATCSALVDEFDSTIVLFFLDDDGNFLATLY